MKTGGLLSLFTLCIISFLNAQDATYKDPTPKYSNEFLNLGVGARAFGMGLSMTSHVEGATAGYWNPSVLAEIQNPHELSLMHASYFAGIASYDYGAFAFKVDDSSAMSVSVIRFSVDDIADTRLLFDANGAVNYDNIRFFSASDYAFIFSYGRKLPVFGGVNIGGNVKVIRRIVGDFAGSWGFGLDVALQKSWGNWKAGLMGRDLFGTFNSWNINEEELADTYARTSNQLYSNSLEITLPRIILGFSRNFDFSSDFSLLASIDLINTFDGRRNTLLKSDLVSVDPNAGVEIGYKEIAFLRMGVGQFQQVEDFDGEPSWTFQPNMGLGFNIQQVSIDYAFTDIGDQAAGLYTHVFSVKVKFRSNEE